MKKSTSHTLAQSARTRTVVVLGTGGTIAGIAPDPARPYEYADSKVAIDSLVGQLPQVPGVMTECEQAQQMGSEDFTEATWRMLRGRIALHLSREEVAGVVLAQGTDTLEETAYFLHLALLSRKPVVVTGAMRPAATLSSDAALNIFQSLSLAASPSARDRGVLVLLNERIYSASDVVKGHTFAGDSFTSPGWGPLGLMLGGVPHWARRCDRGRLTEFQPSLFARPLPRVDVVWSHAGVSRDMVDAAVAAGASGIVYAGTGNGSVASALKPALLEAALQGCAVVRASRTADGIVVRNAAEDDDALMTVAAVGLPAVKARVLLQLGIAAGLSAHQLQQAFNVHSFTVDATRAPAAPPGPRSG